MRKLTKEDIQNIFEYEKSRPQYRERIIALKKNRRISVGNRVSFIFENRETVRFQIQEMLRAERIVEDDRVQDEIDVYNVLIPGLNELSSTMFIEIDEKDKIKQELDRFQGIDRGEHVFFDLAGRGKVPGVFEAGHSKEDKISAVHYVRFALSPEQQKLFCEESADIALVIHHEHYRASTKLNSEVHRSLAQDFLEP